jgi:hypothetical protein
VEVAEPKGSAAFFISARIGMDRAKDCANGPRPACGGHHRTGIDFDWWKGRSRISLTLHPGYGAHGLERRATSAGMRPARLASSLSNIDPVEPVTMISRISLVLDPSYI